MKTSSSWSTTIRTRSSGGRPSRARATARSRARSSAARSAADGAARARQVGELGGQGGERVGAGQDLEEAGVAPGVAAERRQQAGLDERALAAAGRPEDGDEAGGAQALEDARDVLLAAEVEARVLLAEGLEPTVGRDPVGGGESRQYVGAAHRAHQVGHGVRVGGSGAQIDPGVPGEVREARVPRVGAARQEDEHQAEGAVAGGDPAGGGQAVAGPVAQAPAPDEDGAGARGADALDRTRVTGGGDQRQELGLADARREPLGGRPVVRRGQEGDVVARGESGPAELARAREAILRALGHRPPHDVVERRR